MFYERLQALCAECGIRITNLIAELKMSPGNLAKWKSGNTPKADTLVKLADYFDVSTDYLLGRGGAESPALPPDPLRDALLDNYGQLNGEGREKLVDTSDDMVASGKYIKTDPADLGREA